MDTMIREQLQEQHQDYILETLKYIETVREFCDTESEWILQRKKEIKEMKDIKNSSTGFFAAFRTKTFEKELGAVLNNTLEGLKNLQLFLDAVEKLAVTSVFVFMDERFLPKDENAGVIRSVIHTARHVSSYLILFKRDAEAFFLPSLENVEILVFQLHKYTCITQSLCQIIRCSFSLTFHLDTHGFLKNVPDWSQLSKIRQDESFRLMFLFNENAQRFIEVFSECRSRMFEFLSGLEENAVQLDRMKMGSSISTVAGSSVGIVGGAMSVAGLILAPFTAGLSMGLIYLGFGLGATSTINGIVTAITELSVNNVQEKHAKQNFQSLMEDTQAVLDCLEQAASDERPEPDLGEVNVADLAGEGVEVFRKIITVAAEVPEISRLAKDASLVVSKTARFVPAGLNVLFIGLDVAMLCTESVSLAHGEKSKASQSIRSRAALWRAEIQAWDKIYECLFEGKEKFQDNLDILEDL